MVPRETFSAVKNTRVPRETEKWLLTFGEKSSELISGKNYKTTKFVIRFSIKLKKDAH